MWQELCCSLLVPGKHRPARCCAAQKSAERSRSKNVSRRQCSHQRLAIADMKDCMIDIVGSDVWGSKEEVEEWEEIGCAEFWVK